MQTRQLGFSDLHITTVGLGTWAIGGGGWAYAWGPQEDAESITTIHRALDLGINWIDTAAVYGLGHSEEMVGRAVKGRRDKAIIATKCGRVWREGDARIYGDLTANGVKQQIDDSLRRLDVDVIDLFQIHWPDPEPELEEGWGAIADAIRAGKIRYAGVSNFSIEQMQRIMPIHPIASLQPPYSMIQRNVENELLPFCAANNIGIIVYSPMQTGILTGKMTRERIASLPEDDWRKRSPRFQDPELSANLELVERLQCIAERTGHTVAQLAIAWTLHRPEVTAAIVGARQPQQIEETAPAADWILSQEEIQEIEKCLAERGKKLI